jgi:hypothetical protein
MRQWRTISPVASMQTLVDPRVYPKQADAAHAPLIERAVTSLAAPARSQAEAIDDAMVAVLARMLQAQGPSIADLLAQAPSAEVARYLWRRLMDAWQLASRDQGESTLAATFFALPIVVVAAADAGSPAEAPLYIDGVIADTAPLAALLREHRALGASETFALANSLNALDAIDVPRLPAVMEWQRNASGQGGALDLPPSPIPLRAGQESVHLRYVCGTALAAMPLNLGLDATAAGWGMPFAQLLARQIAVPGASVLALPRPPQLPVMALQQGRAAQREVGAQLFASNAIRRLRAAVGEPSAVVSAHRCATAPGGGELRLSLSSPFQPQQAEGFRCPLFPGERVGDVGAMLVDLMRDCRVADIHVVGGVHADRDPVTGLALLFKPDALPEMEPSLLH